MDQRRRDAETGFPTPWLALGVSAAVAVSLIAAARGRWVESLGDTDDAMRLVIVRQLLGGETGWFDNHVPRADGLVIHWSRLVDAGIAGLVRLFEAFLPPDRAEIATRLAWPALWLVPAVWATLSLARRLGGGGAALVAAVTLIINVALYVQWWPGRIDHHDIQIGMTLVAIAGAVRGGRAGGVLAGLATAFGLAVGVEAMPFLAVVGAGVALRFAFDPEAGAAPARAYGLALPLALSLFQVAQSPPSRWAAPLCDALGANLWLAAVLASLGLLAAVRFTAARGQGLRLAALAGAGAAAAGAYVAMDPGCVAGPLAATDPRVGGIWLRYIIELQPLLWRFPKLQSELVISALVFMALGAAGWLWLGRRRETRTFAWMLLGACLLLGAVAAFQARRMASYPSWFAVPLIAAALFDLAARFSRRPLFPAAVAACLVSPAAVVWLTAFLGALGGPAPQALPKRDPVASARCAYRSAYPELARLPPGRVLTEIDLGPYVLARTPHSIFSAPYHRMNRGILAANAALAAPPGEDEARVRALGADYVVNCPARDNQLNHVELGARSLQQRLDRRETPAWLEPLSTPDAWLQIYRVRPNPSAGG